MQRKALLRELYQWQRRMGLLRKRWGQHVMVEPLLLAEIAGLAGELAEEEGAQYLLEVGAGLGFLTRFLVRSQKRVLAVEKDRRMLPHLRRVVPEAEVVEADILQYEPPQEKGVLVGNLPYQLTSPILEWWFSHPQLVGAVVVVQREVGQRIASPPGSRAYGRLSVLLQSVAEVEFVREIPPEAFRPPPEVWSALVRVRRVREAREPEFYELVKICFRYRRKTLRRILRDAFGAEQVAEALGWAERRPETLRPEDFDQLLEVLRPFLRKSAPHSPAA